MGIRYFQTKDGEPELIDTRHSFYEQCCDCGLVHRVRYRVVDKNTIEVRVWRHEKETARVRKRDFKHVFCTCKNKKEK